MEYTSITNRRTLVLGTLIAMLMVGVISNDSKAEPAKKDSNVAFKNFRFRIIEPWHEPDGLSFFSHCPNIFTLKDMRQTTPSSDLGRYVTQVRDWGFNYMAMYGTPEQDPDAWRNFSSHLRNNGIGMIIRREWYETERGHSWPSNRSDASPRKSKKLCPYSKATRDYWEQRIEGDFKMIPDLAGYRMAGTEFFFINGAPWMCDCTTCNTKTPRTRTRDAIRLVAELLKKYNAMLFWETCQDDPWGQRHEAQYFRDMTGDIPDNALVLMKLWYWDFHSHWPHHPLFDTIQTDAQGLAPYVTSIQQPEARRGVHDISWQMVDEWSRGFKKMVKTGQQGVWVMAVVNPDGWDHPLNIVNWHAISVYMKDPFADPAQIKLDWAREQFGKEAAPVVVDIVDKVTEAARGMFFFDTLWTGQMSRFPSLVYLDSHLCGPYRQMKRMTGMMGWMLPTDMYSPERAAEIRANPQTRMVFNQYPITPKLKAEAMAQKEDAVRLMEESIALWRSVKGKIDPQSHEKILAGLEGNLNDTIIFRHMMDLYMDWKLGVLTEARIDAVLNACQGMRGIVVPDPLDPDPRPVTIINPASSLKTFAEDLRRDLREPWVEKHWVVHSLGAGMLEPMIDPNTGKVIDPVKKKDQ